MKSFFSAPSHLLFLQARSRKQIRRRRFGIEPLEKRAMLTMATGDFNGDGKDDLAVGVQNEALPDGVTANGKSNAGAVNVIYGGNKGLKAAGNQFWNQDSPGIDGVAADGDFFGEALATGDFNNDGFDDLAIGVLEDTVSGLARAGSVNVIYGSATGLKATGDQLFNQNSAGINDAVEEDDLFGEDVAVGDFNNDGFDDLAIGVANEDLGSKVDAGAVCVIFGSANGLTGSGDQLWHQDVSGINGVAETGEGFGSDLAVGDFNQDGRDDLAIGVTSDKVGGISAGAVNIIYASASGLSAAGDQLFDQNSVGISDSPEDNDFFSSALAAGDFNGDGFADLAASATGEDGSIGGQAFAGIVHILFGSSTKLSGVGSQSLTRLDFPGVLATVGAIGGSLTAGDFDHDEFDDLAIGAAGAQVGVVASAGLVMAAYGSATGLDASTAQNWNQDTGTIQDAAETSDFFGVALTNGDFDGDGRADLVVSAFRENLTVSDAGLVHVLYGFLTGLTDLGNQIFAQGVGGILGDQEADDGFGV